MRQFLPFLASNEKQSELEAQGYASSETEYDYERLFFDPDQWSPTKKEGPHVFNYGPGPGDEGHVMLEPVGREAKRVTKTVADMLTADPELSQIDYSPEDGLYHQHFEDCWEDVGLDKLNGGKSFQQAMGTGKTPPMSEVFKGD